MKKSNPIKFIIVLILFIAACVAIFYFLSNREEEVYTTENESKVMTAVQEVLSRNLNTNYPPTPKEVLKYYSEISRCFYGEKYTEEQLANLAKKSRDLFDDELRATQSDEDYLLALKAEIDVFKASDKVISSYSVSSSNDVQEYYYDGRDWAQLYCIYSVRIGTKMTSVQERFLMRKDEKGHWKILGWELVEDDPNGQ